MPLPVGYVLYRVEVLLSGSWVAVCAMKRDPPHSRATLAKSTPTCTARTAFQQLCVDDAFREVFPPLLAQPHDNASRASDLTLPNWSA